MIRAKLKHFQLQKCRYIFKSIFNYMRMNKNIFNYKNVIILLFLFFFNSDEKFTIFSV